MSSDGQVLVVEHVSKRFAVRGLGALQAVSDVSLSIRQGETYGLVGETGSGKSTLARLIVRLLKSDSGRIVVDGVDVTNLKGRKLRNARRNVQFVVQDPYSAMNPRLTAAACIAEPLRTHGLYRHHEGLRRVHELLELVGLPASAASRYPHQFSGGQRQRIAIARALAVRPKLIVLDEAVSALDVSMQGQIINLLNRLQEQLGISYLFITHDLSVIRQMAALVGVMYLGRVVESGTVDAVFGRPAHPYTKALLSAVPIVDPERREARRRIPMSGEPPSPFSPPTGCPFHPRCWKAVAHCNTERPILDGTGLAAGHLVACHCGHPTEADEGNGFEIRAPERRKIPLETGPTETPWCES